MTWCGLQMSMVPLVFIIFVLLSPSVTLGQPQAGSCVACHLVTDVEKLSAPARDFAQDIHSAKGFGCVTCHGGDSTILGLGAMDPTKGYIGKPSRAQIPQICGRCHSDAQFMKRYNPSLRIDQVAEYYTSVHGQRLKQFGDPKVATCTSCHSAHGILPPSDPRSSVYPLQVVRTCGSCHADETRMKSYKIPIDQVTQYEKSIHWKTLSEKGDLSAPTCNDCHGNHGAAPPGVAWVGNVCGQCHVVMAELFAQSVHAKIFTQIGSPGCATCHQNHDIQETSDDMVGLGGGAVCASCHSDNDKGGKIAARMRALLDSLTKRYNEAATILTRAEEAGMEISEAQFDLNRAKTALVKARTAIHSFHLEPVEKEIKQGISISEKAYGRGTAALEELRFRRFGLAVSVGIILILILGLVLKIRQLERRT